MCGKEFGIGETSELIAGAIAVSLTVNETFCNERIGAFGYRHHIHNCSDGSIGFANFIGFREEKE
jgi:hypothetical protein